MYRIEVAPGEETVFRTLEELAIGIRNGVITPRARIYHHASQKWLPIGLHPHYKKALEMPAPGASPAPVTSATPLPTASAPKSHAPPLSAPTHHSVSRPPEPKPTPVPSPAPTSAPKAALDSKPPSKASAPERVPSPVSSPVVAMRREVLRDHPVLVIPEPEPLPWQVPAPQVTVSTEPSPRHAFEAPAAHHPVAPQPVAPVPVQPVPVQPVPVQPMPVQPVPAPASMALELPSSDAEHRSTEAEETMPPRPTARRAPRTGGRPLMLLGGAAALVLGAHLALTATPPASADPMPARAPAVEREPVIPAPQPPPASQMKAAEMRATESTTSAPARVVMTPGPAFAGWVPARPGLDSAAAATGASAPTPAPELPGIEPAPAAIQLAMPELATDSLVAARRTGDTLGMKKILRAINGADPAEGSASQ